jgi:hypothetical protein
VLQVCRPDLANEFPPLRTAMTLSPGTGGTGSLLLLGAPGNNGLAWLATAAAELTNR